jgi:uncharacterized protein
VFHASLFIDRSGDLMEIDCRSSDAIALGVRVKAPIFVNEDVMDQAGVLPEADMQEPEESTDAADDDSETLDIFSDFVDTLDFDDFEE